MIGRSCRNSPTECPNWSPNASISLANPKSSALGHTFATSSVPRPGVMSSIEASIHWRARLYASRCASLARPTTNVR